MRSELPTRHGSTPGPSTTKMPKQYRISLKDPDPDPDQISRAEEFMVVQASRRGEVLGHRSSHSNEQGYHIVWDVIQLQARA
jgi:hypothetical protein